MNKLNSAGSNRSIKLNSGCRCCLVIQLCPTLHDPMDQSTPVPPILHCLPELCQIHVGCFDDTVQTSRHLSSPSPLAFTVFSEECSLLMRWPKYWSLSFRICTSNEHSGLISFKLDRFVLKSLLQHHNSKASILRPSAFFIVQLSLPYIATGKTIALTIWTFVSKVRSLLFKMLSRFVIA